jgi:hypothetical protein
MTAHARVGEGIGEGSAIAEDGTKTEKEGFIA